MEWQEIRTALAHLKPPFPHAAVSEARLRWNELAPRFIAEIERIGDGGTTMLDEVAGEYDGLFSFAVYLAAEKRDARAYGPLVRLCHCSEERAHEVFGDDVGSQLGRMLASVCDGNIAPLKALAEDHSAGLWCRYAAIHALAVRVIEGECDRNEVLGYIGSLCEQEADFLRHTAVDDNGELEEFMTWAINVTAELGPAPLLEKIRGWFDEGLIDPSVTDLKWFEQKAVLAVADCIAEAAKDENNRYIRNVLDEMAGWPCYQAPKPRSARKSESSAWPPHAAKNGVSVVRDLPKVGRNDPCPCGSGKKFKKCCDKEASTPATPNSQDDGIARSLTWLSIRHAKAIKTAISAAISDDLDNEEQIRLGELDHEASHGIQVNATEWLLAEGSIAVKGAQRRVAKLLLGPGGPAFTPAQRSWIEQLSRQPLRLYDITDVLPGVGMTLCDALDTEARPLIVSERSGSAHARIGNLIGARIMKVDDHLELSGALYPFSRPMNAALLAELRAAVEGSDDGLPQLLSRLIRRRWIAQYVRPLPIPTVIDAQSGDPILHGKASDDARRSERAITLRHATRHLRT